MPLQAIIIMIIILNFLLKVFNSLEVLLQYSATLVPVKSRKKQLLSSLNEAQDAPAGVQ